MSLTSRQAESWSNIGARDASKKTYNSVDIAINNYNWPKDVKYEVYLQGSYRNSTNIRGDSDVDIVLQFNSTFKRSLKRLNDEEKIKYHNDYSSATRSIQDLQSMTLNALQKYYNSGNVINGDKAIKIETPYLDADVVPCLQYRYYLNYDKKPGNFINGIALYSSKMQSYIINFPKQHIENGEAKNSGTDGNYKPLIRIFKNARNAAIREKLINSDQASSYFIECLMYNVPNHLYENEYSKATDDIIDWLSSADISEFKCQHNYYNLFGDAHDQWDETDCKQYIKVISQII